MRFVSDIIHLLCAVKGYWAIRMVKDDCYLCNRGMGDTLYFLSLLKEYYELNKIEQKINIIIPPNQKVISAAYANYINKTIVVSKTTMENLMHIRYNRFLPHNIKFIIPIGSWDFLGYKGISVWDAQCVTLNLPKINNYVKPVFDNALKMDEIYKKYNITTKKILIISPYAKSVPCINNDIWEKIVGLYEEHGYQVFTNVADKKEQPVKNTQALNEGVDSIFNMCENGAEFIGIRSGLCDLVAFSRCKMTVVYPSDDAYCRDKYTFTNMPFDKTIVECYENEVLNCIKGYF